jgi:hypothetical protein
MGGVRQWYGRVCGGAFPARDTRFMVAPVAAGTRWEEGLSRISHASWLTNDGCPISARFWQMWDTTNLGPLSVRGVDDPHQE